MQTRIQLPECIYIVSVAAIPWFTSKEEDAPDIISTSSRVITGEDMHLMFHL